MLKQITKWFNRNNTSTYQPSEVELKRWASSEWIEYQAWLFHHGFLTLHAWQQLYYDALSWQNRPFFSIITPVFNTDPQYLRECIYSVQIQSYPDWELCLIDDGSQNLETLNCLQTLVASYSRLRLYRFDENQGICKATNQGILMARGNYIAFLDHDDRLAPNALYSVANEIRKQPQTDVLYSDRDMISPNNLRYMHLFKPSWSPETLLSSNYIGHFVVYRRALMQQIGQLDVAMEGSQDHDLILRASLLKPSVKHIPQVLYHWRQHEQSIALQHEAKIYVYEASMNAIRKNLKQRNILATVEEVPNLWRGHYRIRLNHIALESYKILTLHSFTNYAIQVNREFERELDCDYLIILGSNIQAIETDTLAELVSWLQIEEVAISTGKILNFQDKLVHAGLVQRPNGQPLSIYKNFPENTSSYMAFTSIVRNVSTPHPACCVIKRKLWEQLEGLNTDYSSAYALFDFALRSLAINYRIVYTPFARFKTNSEQILQIGPKSDCQRFIEQWAIWLKQGDPYYNPYLSLELVDMGLNLKIPNL
ncbi:MAG: glycosyltransferase [Thiomargarita sp.]|nr:glycosyltransferase [Thiomargarita sp.]